MLILKTAAMNEAQVLLHAEEMAKYAQLKNRETLRHNARTYCLRNICRDHTTIVGDEYYQDKKTDEEENSTLTI